MPKRKDISPETLETVKKLLIEDSNMSLTKVIKQLKLNVSRQTLSKKLRQDGFKEHSKKSPGISKTYSDQDIIDLYNIMIDNGDSLMDFCKKNNISNTTLSTRMKELNLPYLKKNARSINHNYFDILTKENVYWLGFLLADGYVSQKEDVIELGLKDKEHVEKFKHDLSSQHAISEKIDKRWNKPMYRIKFHSANIKGRLIELGIQPNKTYKSYSIPDEILNSGMISDFIRGFFDGDDHISEGKDGVLQQVGFTSFDDQVLLEIKDIIQKELDIEFKLYTREDGTHYLSNYKNGDKEKFLDWLYEDSEIYLQRKYERYLKHCRLGKEIS